VIDTTPITKEELLEKLRQLQRTLNKPYITGNDIKKSEKRLNYYLYLHYDTIAEALEEAGLEPSPLAKSYAKSDDEFLEILWKLSLEKGRRPTTMDLKRAKGVDYRTYKRRFGGIKEAYELAKRKFGEKSKGTFKPTKDKLIGKREPDVTTAGDALKNIDHKSHFYGVAAENLVVSELLYRGYEAYLINVDLGLDVMAQKEGKAYYIQVKNISFDNARRRMCPITKSAYLRNRGNDVCYFFVMQKGFKRDYIIIPYFKFQEYESRGFINLDSDKGKLELPFVKDGSHYYVILGKDSESLEAYTNDKAWPYLK